jgi:hypothetical protein
MRLVPHLNKSWKDSASLFEEDGRVLAQPLQLERHPRHLEPLPAPIDLGEKSEPTVRESAIAGGSLRNVNEQKFL